MSVALTCFRTQKHRPTPEVEDCESIPGITPVACCGVVGGITLEAGLEEAGGGGQGLDQPGGSNISQGAIGFLSLANFFALLGQEVVAEALMRGDGSVVDGGGVGF